MRELTREKKRLIDDHYEKIMQAYNVMAKATENTLKDPEKVGKGNLSVLKIFRSAVEVKTKKSSKLDSDAKAEFAKLDYERSQEVFNEVKKVLRSGTDSLINDIDNQMEIIRKEIEEIDEELKTADVDTTSGEVWENPVTRERATILERPWDNPAGRGTAELTALVGARVAGNTAIPLL